MHCSAAPLACLLGLLGRHLRSLCLHASGCSAGRRHVELVAAAHPNHLQSVGLGAGQRSKSEYANAPRACLGSAAGPLHGFQAVMSWWPGAWQKPAFPPPTKAGHRLATWRGQASQAGLFGCRQAGPPAAPPAWGWASPRRPGGPCAPLTAWAARAAWRAGPPGAATRGAAPRQGAAGRESPCPPASARPAEQQQHG